MSNIINTFKDIFCKFKLDNNTWAFIGKLYFLILIFTLILLNLGVINISAEEKTITDDKSYPVTRTDITDAQYQWLLNEFNSNKLSVTNTAVFKEPHHNDLVLIKNCNLSMGSGGEYIFTRKNSYDVVTKISPDGVVTTTNRTYQYVFDINRNSEYPPKGVLSLYTDKFLWKPFNKIICKHNLYGDCQIKINNQVVSTNQAFIGDNVEITAIPKSDGKFINWSNGITTQSLSYNPIVNDIDITANFEKIDSTGPIDPTPPPTPPSTDKIDITFKSNISNSFFVEFPNQPHLNGNTTISIDKGSQLAFIIKPVDGYNITRISDGYVTYTPNQQYSYSFDYNTTFNITSERVNTPEPPPLLEKVNITFTSPFIDSFSVEYPDNLSLNGNKTIQVDKGSQLKFIIKPIAGYNIINITDGTSQFSVNVVNSIICNRNITISIQSEKIDTSKPPITLPTPQINNNININVNMSNEINQNISSYYKDGSFIIHRIDYFNMYTIGKEYYEANKKPGTENYEINKYISYDSVGYTTGGVGELQYIIPVYSHSKVFVNAPNMCVSTHGFTFIPYNPDKFPTFAKFYANASGLLKRDINEFIIEYSDIDLKQKFSFAKVPINFANDKATEVMSYQGQIGTSKVEVANTLMMSYVAKFESESILYEFAITDPIEDVQNAMIYVNTQTNNNANTGILNNAINAFKDMFDNLFQHGNASSQQAQQQLNDKNNLLNQTNNKFEQLENQYSQDLQNNLNQIKPDDHKLSAHQGFLNATKFVKLQFDELTRNNPIGQVLGFSLMIGLALLLLSKRL